MATAEFSKFAGLLSTALSQHHLSVYTHIYIYAAAKSLQSCPTLCDPTDSSPPGSAIEPDILECEVKWALESITMNKASGGDGIPVELFQILKDDAVKVLHSICQQIWTPTLPGDHSLSAA